MTRDGRTTRRKAPAAASSTTTLDPNWLTQATSEELADTFRKVSTLPIESFMNAGGHSVDVAAHTIFNDEHWKGWLPRGLVVRDIFTRLATGYAKRFWKQGNKYLGETRYLEGRILVKHALEEITIDRPTNDLDPGSYILLRYTDPVFEHLFYDVMKAADEGVIVYGGYTGKFPEGTRGFTSILMRRYSFAQLGVRDHQQLSRKGTRPAIESTAGTWRLEAVATSNHAARVGTLTIASAPDGAPTVQYESAPQPDVLVPSFLAEHFTAARPQQLLREWKMVDPTTIVGTWQTEISPLYARFVSASPGLFHREGEKGDRRYTLRYMLTRT